MRILSLSLCSLFFVLFGLTRSDPRRFDTPEDSSEFVVTSPVRCSAGSVGFASQMARLVALPAQVDVEIPGYPGIIWRSVAGPLFCIVCVEEGFFQIMARQT